MWHGRPRVVSRLARMHLSEAEQHMWHGRLPAVIVPHVNLTNADQRFARTRGFASFLALLSDTRMGSRVAFAGLAQAGFTSP